MLFERSHQRAHRLLERGLLLGHHRLEVSLDEDEHAVAHSGVGRVVQGEHRGAVRGCRCGE